MQTRTDYFGGLRIMGEGRTRHSIWIDKRVKLSQQTLLLMNQWVILFRDREKHGFIHVILQVCLFLWVFLNMRLIQHSLE